MSRNSTKSKGRRIVYETSAAPFVYKRNKKPFCQFCSNEMTGEMDVGRLLPVRVCDRDWCRDAARALKGENDGT